MGMKCGRRRAVVLAFIVAAVGSACDSPLSERTIDLRTPGHVIFLLFRDDNLSGTRDEFDPMIPNATIVLRRAGVMADSLTYITDELGRAPAGTLEVGRYFATVAASVRGDTLVSAVDSVEFDVLAGDSIVLDLGLQYPQVDIAELRESASGRKVWIRGVVLNTAGTFGDSTMHFVDETAAVRAINLRFNLPLSPGDTVDLLGTRRARDGLPAIDPLVAVPRAGGLNPPPVEVSTAEAATAADTTLDAAFVIVRNAEVTDTATTFGARILTVDDGSGPLVVSLHLGINPSQLNVPGARLNISGLLVPDPATSAWVLKPRLRNDIEVQSSSSVARVDDGRSLLDSGFVPPGSRRSTVTAPRTPPALH
jgi:hypothetical protein